MACNLGYFTSREFIGYSSWKTGYESNGGVTFHTGLRFGNLVFIGETLKEIFRHFTVHRVNMGKIMGGILPLLVNVTVTSTTGLGRNKL